MAGEVQTAFHITGLKTLRISSFVTFLFKRFAILDKIGLCNVGVMRLRNDLFLFFGN